MTDRTILEITGIIIEQDSELTLADLSRCCAVHAEFLIELVDEGVLVPTGPTPQRWRFNSEQLQRARRAIRLQRDLGLNLPGVALAIELLEELELLRSRLPTDDA